MDAAGFDELVGRLAQLRRIAFNYVDNNSVEHKTTAECRQALLRAMGIRCATPAQAKAALTCELRELWQGYVDPFMTVRQNEAGDPAAPVIELTVPDYWESAGWRLTAENGQEYTGTLSLRSLECLEEQVIEGDVFRRLRFDFPHALPSGIYMLSWLFGEGSGAALREMEILVHPHGCYVPPHTAAGEKCFGFDLLPRSLASNANWGAGNWGDVRRLGRNLAERGADFLFLPPPFAIEPLWGMQSPYYTTTRRQASHLLVDLEAAMERLGLGECLKHVREEEFRRQIKKLRGGPMIDFCRHDPLVIETLERMWCEFEKKNGLQTETLFDFPAAEDAEAPDARHLREYIRKAGPALLRYVEYCIMREEFFTSDNLNIKDPQAWDFRKWSDPFRRPGGAWAVDLRRRRPHRSGFYAFILWLARSEIAAVQEELLAAGMRIGLWMAMPVGVSVGGADHYCDQQVMLDSIGIGAPPDALAAEGQNWGPRLRDPVRLRRARYMPLREDLQFAMSLGGGVFIDHGMIIDRIYAVPEGFPAKDSTYVHYRREEVLGILAYLSHKHRCVVGVEAVGTVPPDFTKEVGGWNIATYCIERFSRENWETGEFLSPEKYPWMALATNANYNITPTAGFFHEWDIMLWSLLGKVPQPELTRLRLERDRDRRLMLEFFIQRGLISREQADSALALAPAVLPSGQEALRRIEERPFPDEILTAEAVSVLQTNSAFAVLDLDTLLGSKRMLNVPGSDVPAEGKPGYHNWIQMLNKPLEEIPGHPVVAAVLEAAAKLRPRRS